MSPLRCPFAPPAAIDRRVAVRRPCRPGTAAGVAADNLLARNTRIANLSVTGLALRLRQRVRRGARLLIQMTNEPLGLAYDLAARVIHCTREPDGKWLVGCASLRELSPSELETLL